MTCWLTLATDICTSVDWWIKDTFWRQSRWVFSANVGLSAHTLFSVLCTGRWIQLFLISDFWVCVMLPWEKNLNPMTWLTPAEVLSNISQTHHHHHYHQKISSKLTPYWEKSSCISMLVCKGWNIWFLQVFFVIIYWFPSPCYLTMSTEFLFGEETI